MKIGGYNYGAMRVRRAIRPIVRGFRSVGLRPTDVLASYLKSGSTWARFMLTDLLVGRDPNGPTCRERSRTWASRAR